MVLALNMIDVIRKSGDTIDARALAQLLGCPVIETSAVTGVGLKELVQAAIASAESGSPGLLQAGFSEDTEKALSELSALLGDTVPPALLRWYTIKLFEQDEKVLSRLKLSEMVVAQIKTIIERTESKLDDSAESIITNERYNHISRITARCLVRKTKIGAMTISDKIDRVVTNRWLALPLFFLAMWGVYFISIQSIGDLSIGWVEWLFNDLLGANIAKGLEAIGTSAWLTGLVVDGIIGGVGAVITFVPQMMILFFFLALMEDCGYMARVAFIMDRIFRKFGLSGKSFIPMLIGTGCSVPAIMASRTIENQRDRRMTIMLTPFIPCGAKLPVFALFVGVFFPKNTFIGPSMYLIGIIAVILSGILLKRTRLFAGDPAPFVMELPAYHMPRIKGVLVHMWDRGKAFIKKAGTIIAVASAGIWILQSTSWGLQMVEPDASILASLGKILAPVFQPLGFGFWEASVATITGLLAKETIVATLGILAGVGEVAESDPTLILRIGQLFTPLSAYAFMIFTLLAAPCAAAIGATRREMQSARWTWIAILFQTGLAYVAALLVFQIGSLFV